MGEAGITASWILNRRQELPLLSDPWLRRGRGAHTVPTAGDQDPSGIRTRAIRAKSMRLWTLRGITATGLAIARAEQTEIEQSNSLQ